MRVILGGVVGFLLAAILIAALSTLPGIKTLWPVLPAGVLAGLAMRTLGAARVSTYLRGAVAAAATAVAAVVGPMLTAQWLTAQSSAPVTIQSNQAAAAPADEPQVAGDGAALPEPEPVVQLEQTGPARQTVDDPFGAPLDIAWLAIGCLIAYQLGKGKESPYADEEAADEQPPAEPGPHDTAGHDPGAHDPGAHDAGANAAAGPATGPAPEEGAHDHDHERPATT
ncbi:hypothetical protein [Botrimarina sp.]|uniref:hypothetical protein n=1 Tax=Botrimarina sp. TaxID=2795802 RepID=UPI0032EBD381